MGSGKTTVGRILATKLGWRFIDTDKLIVEQTGKEISDLFQERGEVYFRQVEKEIISHLPQVSRTVIATGGGAVIDRTNYLLIKENGLVYYLKASPSVLARRSVLAWADHYYREKMYRWLLLKSWRNGINIINKRILL